MTEPFFSIVIPVYNRAKSIMETLESVLSQDYSSYECIVVDDGSVDGSELERLVASIKDPRFVYIRQDNAGGSAARNTGILKAKGQFIAFLDSDDLFTRDHLSSSRSIAQHAPQNTCIYSQVIVDRGDGVSFLKPPRAIKPDEHMGEYLLCDRGFVQPSSLIVPAALAKQVQFLKGLRFGQDTDFAIRLYLAGGRFVMKPTPGAIWRDYPNPNRVSTNLTASGRLEWLKSIEANLPHRALIADKGWFVAKAYARDGKIGKALTLYTQAVIGRAYSRRLAIAVLGQIIVPPNLYRKVADTIVAARQRLA